MEKQKSESPSPTRNKQYTAVIHKRSKKEKEVRRRTRSATADPATKERKDESILPPSKLPIGSRLSAPSKSDAQLSNRQKSFGSASNSGKGDKSRLNRGPAAARSHSSPKESILPDGSNLAPNRSKRSDRRGIPKILAAKRCPISCTAAAKSAAAQSMVRSVRSNPKNATAAVGAIRTRKPRLLPLIPSPPLVPCRVCDRTAFYE